MNRDYKIAKKLVRSKDNSFRSFMMNVREIKSAPFLSRLLEIEIFNSTLFLDPIITFRIITFASLRFSNKETRSVPIYFQTSIVYIYIHIYTHDKILFSG